MTALYIALGSAVLLALFCLLLRVEQNVGRRLILSRLRAALDRGVVRLHRFVAGFHPHVGSGAMRIMFHSTLQRILTQLLRVNASMRERLEGWRTRNRMLVRSAREAREKTHLDLIAEHKAESALDERAREALKRQAIERE